MRTRVLLCSALVLVALGASASDADAAKRTKTTTHVVYPGQTLGKIAKRYGVSIDALCTANHITRRSKIRPKQSLLIPASDDTDGRRAAASSKAKPKGNSAERASGKRAPAAKRSDAGNSWKTYARPAPRAGFVRLEGTGGRWSGYALVKGGRVPSRAREAFEDVFSSWRTGKSKKVDERLIRLLTQISDTFGGRPLRIVSGYRTHSYSSHSKHKLGRACDFSVVGVPNSAVRDFLRTLENTGVGYYPNSTFVHLDVRSYNAYWVDHSGPGEPPRHHSGKKSATTESAAPPTPLAKQ